MKPKYRAINRFPCGRATEMRRRLLPARAEHNTSNDVANKGVISSFEQVLNAVNVSSSSSLKSPPFKHAARLSLADRWTHDKDSAPSCVTTDINVNPHAIEKMLKATPLREHP